MDKCWITEEIRLLEPKCLLDAWALGSSLHVEAQTLAVISNEIVENGGKAIKSIREHESGSDRIAEAVAEMNVDIVVNVDLEMLDPTGVVVEKWILEGTFLSDVNFDSLGYGQDALATISTTLRMDRCILVY